MTDPTSPEALEIWQAIAPALDALTAQKGIEIRAQRAAAAPEALTFYESGEIGVDIPNRLPKEGDKLLVIRTTPEGDQIEQQWTFGKPEKRDNDYSVKVTYDGLPPYEVVP